jgi:hypothetical protein
MFPLVDASIFVSRASGSGHNPSSPSETEEMVPSELGTRLRILLTCVIWKEGCLS